MKKTAILLTIITLIPLSMDAQKITKLNSKQSFDLISQNKNIVILDVRTSDEFMAGHIAKAINIDVLQPNFYEKIDKLDHTKTYLVYCRTHHRSDKAIEYMKNKKFKALYQIQNGFSDWANNQLPYNK